MRYTHTERQRHRQREKQAPCREPGAGLDPGTPGSGPGLKADARPRSHPGCPPELFLRGAAGLIVGKVPAAKQIQRSSGEARHLPR